MQIVAAAHRTFCTCCCRKPYRKGLTPYYFAAVQPGLSGNEQFFYFTSLVSSCKQQHTQCGAHHPATVIALGLCRSARLAVTQLALVQVLANTASKHAAITHSGF